MAIASVALIEEQAYIVHMDKNKVAANYREFYKALIDSVNNFSSQDEDEDQETSSPQLLYVYETAISGFAAKLSIKQLELLKQVDGFLSATPDELLTLHTTHSYKFLSLENGRGLWSASNLAKDVIVGVIDTGIWPEHISFQDKGMSPVPSKWKGVCEEGTKFSQSNCNKKLIGARAFFKGYETIIGRIDETVDFRSPRDAQGHGTHTASTAAGNLVSNASFFGLAKGSAGGMRYTSRIAAYKGCWSLGCTSTDILAAIDKAVADGVDVLSLSLGGSSRPYYSDLIAIASFAATQNGVFVSCSAGNSGPSSSTVSNTAPWIMTVAASYTDRSFPAIVKLGNGQVFEGSSLYYGKATKQLQVVYAKTAGSRGAEYCMDGTLDQKLVKGKIVVCQRGINGRAKKGEIVKLAKGAGMIIVNNKNEGEELFADPHILPAAALGASAGETIKKYMNSTKKPTASIVFKGTVFGKTAPVMAAFSSRGPTTPFAYGSGHVDPETASDPGLIYDISTNDYLNYLCSLNYSSTEMNLFSGGNFTCPKKNGDLNYPSFAVNFNGDGQNITMEYLRTVTNVGTPTSSYAVQVVQPNGVSVTVKPKILSFNKLGQKLSYKVTFVGLGGSTRASSNSSFGSLTWVYGKYVVRSPIAVIWQ
ncbi:hypothetical protein LWI29_002223 [Acer saccharum]|uniref:Subtilisin-like protease n=1 Tax=Acer saccharum TaxID=4024 RepID=A0AA39RUH3_ACESA|nr:hypothetical protein LWI29_002223 [Acer saccharum]